MPGSDQKRQRRKERRAEQDYGHPELLIPASSLEVMKTAVVFGADAVYIGGEAFGLRAKAKNFSMEDMKRRDHCLCTRQPKGICDGEYSRAQWRPRGVEAYLRGLKEVRPDALIIADPGVFAIAKRVCPEIDAISARRQIIQIMRRTASGMSREQSGSFPHGSSLWQRSKRSGRIFRMIWRSRRLCTVRCVSPIPEDAC